MPKFRATVQVTDLDGADPVEARRALEESFGRAGVQRWRIVSIDRQVVENRTRGPALPLPPPQPRSQINFGGLLLVGSVVWLIWLVWTLAGPSTD